MPTERSITITAMSRPALFARLLESLVQNDLDGWRIVLRVEPTQRSGEFVRLAEDMLSGFEYDLRVNREVLGITHNPYNAIEEAFAGGSKLNLYLEEDFVVAPDATALAAWYERQHRPGWLCLSLLAGVCGSAGFLSDERYPELLFTTRSFNSIGFAMRAEEWATYAREAWPSNRPHRARNIHANWRLNWGWDWSLYGVVAGDPALRTVQPALARATHTGREGGTYASPEFHDAAFGKLPINRDREVAYRLEDIGALPHVVRATARLHEELTAMRLQMEQVALGESDALSTVLVDDTRARHDSRRWWHSLPWSRR